MSSSPATLPVLRVQDLTVDFNVGFRKRLRAVAGVSFDVERSSVVAIIGESGSGKSTIARSICGLGPVTEGAIRFEGQILSFGGDRAATAGAAGIQMVFQDSFSALDPRWPVWKSIAEPNRKAAQNKANARALATDLLKRVGLPGELADRGPSELSGGQRQRVTIARALAGKPKLLVLDEAVSALDVSVRNGILGLLEKLRKEEDLTFLFVSHDMGAVAQIATHVVVLYLGKVVEIGAAKDVISRPSHPYTKALIAAVPTIGPRSGEMRAAGEIGDPANPPSGCRYHPRCAFADAQCAEIAPSLEQFEGKLAACLRIAEINRASVAL